MTGEPEAGGGLDVDALALVGGHLALDFANTTSWRGSGAPRERLRAFDDLIRWGRKAGLVDAAGARRLHAEAARHPRRAERALGRAREVRETIYRVFTAVAAGARPADADLSSLSAAWRESAAGRELDWQRGTPAWRHATDPADPARLVWPIVDAAVALLFDAPERDRVKACLTADCNWLYVDRSRNRSRRWCDMADCGNRAKARRFQQRHRAQR